VVAAAAAGAGCAGSTPISTQREKLRRSRRRCGGEARLPAAPDAAASTGNAAAAAGVVSVPWRGEACQMQVARGVAAREPCRDIWIRARRGPAGSTMI
jgi:hypothetical protein